MSATNYIGTMSMSSKRSVFRWRPTFVVVLALSAVAVWLSASYVHPQALWLHWLIVWLMCAISAYALHPWIPSFLQRRRERRRTAAAAGGSGL